MNRRDFLRLSAGGALLASPLASFGADYYAAPRSLFLHRAATNEGARITYWQDGQYLPQGYTEICYLLRDVQARQITQMDTTLLDILNWIQAYFAVYGWHEPLIINSGYRTRHTNNHTEGAVKNSMHLYGKAVDCRMTGVPADYLGKLVAYLRAGGIGVYPNRNFVHIDTGRLRSWRG